MKYGSAVVGGGLLAGCAGNGEEGTTTSTGTPTEATTETESPEDTSYSVTMEPVGEVVFNELPGSWLTMTAGYADMGIALGQQPPKGITTTARYHTHHYEDIPDVSVNKEDIVELNDTGIDKELFYSLDVDIHVFDTNLLINRIKNL